MKDRRKKNSVQKHDETKPVTIVETFDVAAILCTSIFAPECECPLIEIVIEKVAAVIFIGNESKEHIFWDTYGAILNSSAAVLLSIESAR